MVTLESIFHEGAFAQKKTKHRKPFYQQLVKYAEILHDVIEDIMTIPTPDI